MQASVLRSKTSTIACFREAKRRIGVWTLRLDEVEMKKMRLATGGGDASVIFKNGRLLGFGEFLVFFGELGGGGIAFVNDDSIAEGDRFTFGDLHIAGAFGEFLIELVEAECVGGDKAVGARMPWGGMARV